MLNSLPASLAFRDALTIAKNQIEAEVFSSDERMVLESVYKVMAEVYAAPEEQTMLIDREEVSARQVQEVYRLLDEDHVKRVILWYLANKRAAAIVSTKRYLRTMLYNAYFETDALTMKGW